LFQQEILAQQPTLADAISNLGIVQQPTPSANGVINNPTLAEMSNPSPQVLPEQ
jgi:hypothetical protein